MSRAGHLSPYKREGRASSLWLLSCNLEQGVEGPVLRVTLLNRMLGT